MKWWAIIFTKIVGYIHTYAHGRNGKSKWVIFMCVLRSTIFFTQLPFIHTQRLITWMYYKRFVPRTIIETEKEGKGYHTDEWNSRMSFSPHSIVFSCGRCFPSSFYCYCYIIMLVNFLELDAQDIIVILLSSSSSWEAVVLRNIIKMVFSLAAA